MESSSSNLEERELQQMQLEERELHQKCLAWFKKLKSHLGKLHMFWEVTNTRPFEIAFRILLCEEHQTFREKMYHILNQLQWQIKRDNLHSCDPKTRLDVLRKQFKEFFDSKEMNASDFHNKYWQKDFKDYIKWEPETYRHILLLEVQAIKEIGKWLKEREIHQQESLVTEGTTLEASSVIEGASLEAYLVTEGAALEANLVTEGITLDASLVTKKSIVDSSTSSAQ
ncbi:hypothetical protein Tco_1548536 [Tanacetum coccineum]